MSQTADGVKGNAISERPSISADGQQVAFVSAADNLSPDDTDGFPDVFVKDLQTGQARPSRPAPPTGRRPHGGGSAASLSADGSTVAFASNATNLSPDAADGRSHVYVKNLDSGHADSWPTAARSIVRTSSSGPTTRRCPRTARWSPSRPTPAVWTRPTPTSAPTSTCGTSQTGQLRLASVNGDGVEGRLARPATRRCPVTAPWSRSRPRRRTWIRGIPTSRPTSTSRTSRTDRFGSGRPTSHGVKANQSVGYPSLSADGSYLAFSTDATNLGIDTPPLVKQIYRKNLDSGELEPVSVTADGIPGDYLSIDPSVAGDGSVVAFYSPSTNLVADGGNRVADVMAKVLSASIPPSPSDVVSPTARLQAWPSTLPANRGTKPVRLTGTAADEGGIATVTFSVTDEYGEVQPTIDPEDGEGKNSLSWQQVVQLSSDLHQGDCERIYTIAATVSDLAGNVTTTSTQVHIGGRTSWHS